MSELTINWFLSRIFQKWTVRCRPILMVPTVMTSLLLIFSVSIPFNFNWKIEFISEDLHSNEQTLNNSMSIKFLFDIISQEFKRYSQLSMTDPYQAISTYGSSKYLDVGERWTLKYFIEDYIHFHSKYRREHSRSKYLIFWSPHGGLGDRVKSLVEAYWAAVVSKRILLIERSKSPQITALMTGSSNLSLFLEQEYLDQNISSKLKVDNMSIAFLNARHSGSELGNDEALLSSDIKTVIFHSRVHTGYSKHFINHNRPTYISLRNMLSIKSSTNFTRAVLHHILRVNDNVKQYFDDEMKRLNSETRRTLYNGTGESYYISVHARIGEGVAELGERFDSVKGNKQATAKFLATKAMKLSTITDSYALPIFLATDTLQFRKIFSETVQSLSKGKVPVFHGGWDIYHSKRDDGQLIETFLDLLILGHGKHIVSLRSGFPDIAQGFGISKFLVQYESAHCLSDQ